MSFGRYALVVLAVAGGSLGLLSGLLRQSLGPAALEAALLGGLLAAANTLAAYALVLWSMKRSMKTFLGAVLGGMLGRMGLMLVAVAAAVVRLGLPQVPLIVSLLSYFVVFLALELTVLNRKARPREALR